MNVDYFECRLKCKQLQNLSVLEITNKSGKNQAI